MRERRTTLTPKRTPTVTRTLTPTPATPDGAAAIPGHAPRFTPTLRRLPRNVVAPNKGTTAPLVDRSAHVDVDVDVDVQHHNELNLGGQHAHDSQRHHEQHSDINVNFWFANPCNRQVCSIDPFGCEFGYVFCDSSVWSYSYRRGCAPSFVPYRYYWSPSCYWLPSYCPSYATVYVVHDYVDVPSDVYYGTPPAESAPVAMTADPTALLAAGWAEFEAGNFGGAADSFRQAVLASPDDPWAKIGFAQALFAVGNYPDAAFLLRRAAELLPDWPLLGSDPRAHYGDPADHAEQMVALRSFLDRLPGEPAATLVLAVQSYFTGDLAVARESFGALVALDSLDSVAGRFLARLHAIAPPMPPAAPLGTDGK